MSEQDLMSYVGITLFVIMFLSAFYYMHRSAKEADKRMYDEQMELKTN